MQDQILKIFEQFDRTGSPIRQASARSDARPQAFPPSRNDDRRHRTHAPDQKRSIQTRQASRQKQNRFRDLECSARRVTSADFQASDCSAYNVCTTTGEGTLDVSLSGGGQPRADDRFPSVCAAGYGRGEAVLSQGHRAAAHRQPAHSHRRQESCLSQSGRRYEKRRSAMAPHSSATV